MKINGSDYRRFTKSFDSGNFPHYRFGQAFINHFKVACPHKTNDTLGTNHPCIFSEPDRAKAEKWIEANLLDWSK